jgi:hypothetical protein
MSVGKDGTLTLASHNNVSGVVPRAASFDNPRMS